MKRAKQLTPILAAAAITILSTTLLGAAPKKLAVLEFHDYAGLTEPEVMYVTDLVRGAAVGTLPSSGFLVMTRESIFELLPPGKKLSDCKGECEVETGRNIGADYIVSGELLRYGKSLRVSLKLFDTETSRLLATKTAGAADVDGLEASIRDVSPGLFRKIAVSGALPGDSAAQGFEEGAIGEKGYAWRPGGDAEVVVRFVSVPEKATVELVDQPICDTPCSRALRPGAYDVAIKKVKWITERSTVKVEAGMGPVSWTLKPDFGWLTVKSDPAGLDVSINGKVEGKTPITRREVPPGRYEVLVTDPRYFDQGERVAIERGEDEVIDVTLEPRQGGIKVEAVDDGGNAVEGDVYLDGEKVGLTYAPIPAIIGRHEVAVRSGRGGWTGVVEVVERKTAVVEAGLTGGSVIRPQGAKRGSSSLGIEMVEIPAGRFLMGSPGSEEGRSGDERQHEVVIGRPFLAAKHEVTQGLWRAVMGSNPSRFDSCGDDCPVENLTWHETVEFCNRLSEREGLAPAYRIGGKDVIWDRSANGYRLPTEAEWEYACRAGMGTPFHTDRCLSADEANYAGNYPQEGCAKGRYRETTVAVGGFSANAWGLHDMHGNVWEWCWDWYDNYPKGTVTDPTGPSGGSPRVDRGGCWSFGARLCRSAYRSLAHPGLRGGVRRFSPLQVKITLSTFTILPFAVGRGR